MNLPTLEILSHHQAVREKTYSQLLEEQINQPLVTL